MNLPKVVDSLFEMKSRVATLTFNRDDVRNALTGTALAEDIVTVVNWCNTTERVSVLVITGAGSAFSSGGNVCACEMIGAVPGSTLPSSDEPMILESKGIVVGNSPTAKSGTSIIKSFGLKTVDLGIACCRSWLIVNGFNVTSVG